MRAQHTGVSATDCLLFMAVPLDTQGKLGAAQLKEADIL